MVEELWYQWMPLSTAANLLKRGIEEERAQDTSPGGIGDVPQENPLGGWVGSEKPDRSWGVWEFPGKVRNKVIKVLPPEGKDHKAESLFWGIFPPP